ncbi:hypothetical protein HYC85_003919 [Camellia sinensis]|uniref:Uncharacterized protein n=1 Tax=Camellia sinensis TaxID=4442 RepID=A0A7J7HX77_CAMSI|nr:hypothetical protein HYC85_003919 [Camellia sinensis]
MFGGYLVFDPSKSPNYKVVLISYIRNSEGCFYLIDIYSSESASWAYMRAAAPPGYSFTKRCCAMGFKILEMERDCCHWIEKYQNSVMSKLYCSLYENFYDHLKDKMTLSRNAMDQ